MAMKYLLVLVVVLVAIGLWRHNRRDAPTDTPNSRPTRPPEPTPPTDMVACAHCSVHVPRNEALPGRQGLYCSPAHRTAREGSA